MQTPVFNSHPMVPAMHLFQLPVMNAAWMDFYKSSVAATTSAQHSAPKKKGFNIADILSEEKPSETVMHMASHPYYPAVQQTSIPAHLPDRTVLRQCRNKRVRTIFTPDQLEQLEKIFEKQQYMVGTERYYLASKLQLSEAQVKVWFQNRRIKWRKQSGLDGSRSTDIDESTSRDRRGDFSDSCSESGLSETGSL